METTFTITGRSNYAVICISYTNAAGSNRDLACLVLNPGDETDVTAKIVAEIIKNEAQ